ncbi:hypothetical protein AB0M66_23090 [Streptomyces albidoflavus]|uniref:hypothetical protein n=1 Tax=Streptomyces albidoflavus TaxID=1886 RepID=UPI003445335F
MFGIAAIGRALDAVAKRWLQRGRETDRQRRMSFDMEHQTKAEKYEARKAREREEAERVKHVRELCDTAIRSIYAALPAEKKLTEQFMYEGAQLKLKLKDQGQELDSRELAMWIVAQREMSGSPDYDEALAPVRETLAALSPYLLIQWPTKYPTDFELLDWIRQIKMFRESMPITGVSSSLLDM